MQHFSEEHKKKIGIALKGRTFSEETKRKMGNAHVGEKCYFWKGGRIKYVGYWHVLKKEHPNCTANGYVREHRLLMEEKMGRYLTPEEIVHHVDGNPYNNDIKNLELMSQVEHSKIHKRNFSPLNGYLKLFLWIMWGIPINYKVTN